MGLVSVNMSPDMSRGAFALYSIVCKTRWSVMAINKARSESSCSPVSENLDRRASDSRIRDYGITIALFAVCEIVATFKGESKVYAVTRGACVDASTRSPINQRPRATPPAFFRVTNRGDLRDPAITATEYNKATIKTQTSREWMDKRSSALLS